MLSPSWTSLLALALPLCRVTAAPSPTIQPRQGGLAPCAASMNGALPTTTPPGFVFSGNVRQFYVAAEEIEWNYAPTGWDNWLGVPLNLSPRAKMAGALEYGTTWLKALYRGYTDSSFTTRTVQPPWQGTQGPTLRAEVGDMIEIMFLNRLTVNYATMHSMGLAYTKYAEGGDYPNNTAPGQQVNQPLAEAVPPGVPPGDCVVYKWLVDDLSGPPAGQPAQAHSYHSYVALQQDTNAGLIGPTIIYAAGQMASTMANYREFPLLYMIYNEMDSFLSNQNAANLKGKGGYGGGPIGARSNGGGPPSNGGGQPNNGGGQPNNGGGQPNNGGGQPKNGGGSPASTRAASSINVVSPSSSGAAPSPSSAAPSSSGGAPSNSGGGYSFGAGEYGGMGSINSVDLYPGNYSTWHPQLVNLASSNQFMGAPSFYSMNGYIFANNPTYEMCLSDKVIWYVSAYGSMSHVFHMHGNGFYYNGVGLPSISVNDGEMRALYMNATGAGKWQVICHVNYHQTLGMESMYQVFFAGQCPLPAIGSDPGSLGA